MDGFDTECGSGGTPIDQGDATGEIRLVHVLRALQLLDGPPRLPVPPPRPARRLQAEPAHRAFRCGVAAVELLCDHPDIARIATATLTMSGHVTQAVPSAQAAPEPEPPPVERSSPTRPLPVINFSPPWVVTMARTAGLGAVPPAMAGAIETTIGPEIRARWCHTEPLGHIWWLPDHQALIHHRPATRWVGARYLDLTDAPRLADLLVTMALSLQNEPHRTAPARHARPDEDVAARHRLVRSLSHALRPRP